MCYDERLALDRKTKNLAPAVVVAFMQLTPLPPDDKRIHGCSITHLPKLK